MPVREDILRCISVSHQIRAIVEPIFYREVHLSTKLDVPRDPHRRLRRFTRTITSRPELGLLVKHLHASDPEMEIDSKYKLEGLPELTQLERLSNQ